MLVDLSALSTEDLAWLVLGRLEQDGEGMTEETVELCHTVLSEAVSILRGTMNDRKPLLNLPVEILARIMEYIPDLIDHDLYEGTSFKPFWCHTISDSLMLMPITHTCRQLREIALSTPLLWSTFIASPPEEISSEQEFMEELMARSEDVPLRVLLSPSKQFTKLVEAFYPMHARRVEELHLCDVGHRHMKYLESLLSHESPLLKSYSFDGRAGSLSKWHTHALPLPPNSASTLQDLYINEVPLLPELPLPALTHLALCNINLPGLHSKVARVVRSCPNLVALALSNDARLADLELDQAPQPAYLPRLRRLTLSRVDCHSLNFYLNLIPPAHNPIVLQVLNYQIDMWSIPSGPSLAHAIQGPIRTLAFASHRVNSDFTVSVTATASARAFHIVSCFAHSRRIAVGQWLDRLLGLGAAAHTFCAVREVWVTHGDARWGVHAETVRAAIAALHMLETVVLVYRRARQAQTVVGGTEPDLALCPDAEDPAFNSPLLRTVRIVCYSHGQGDDGGQPGAGEADVDRRSSGFVLQVLTFVRMLEQLRSGEKYRYLDRIVLQLDRSIVPIPEQMERLREYVKEVVVETVDEQPAFPLPAACYEPRAGPGGDFRRTVAGALW